MRKLRILLAILFLLGATVVVVGLRLVRNVGHYRVTLADGTSFSLKQVTLTATNFNYSHQSRGPLWNILAPVLPASILQKVTVNRGGFGVGSNGSTNLFVVTDQIRNQSLQSVSVGRLRISDGTNSFDASWGASTLSWNNEIVNGWQVRAFPRRSADLSLEFLARTGPSTNWEIAARFKVANPAAGEFPRWDAGPRVQTDGNLQVHLEKFRSGATMDPARSGNDPQTVARKTELLFTLEQDGQATEDWRVQKLIISDATGNNWFPYLDLETQRFNWAKGGQVEFLGALWPGENAWKLEVELSRIARLGTEDTFTFEMALPGPATIINLTNQWSRGGTTINFVALASPDTEHLGNLKWTGKWWGEDKDKVYSLVLTAKPDLQKQRLHLVSAVDQNNNSVKLLEHRGQDYSDQGLFLLPEPGAQKVKLTFSLTSSRFVQFMARPEFVE